MGYRSFISGCSGLALTDRERAFFADARPCGLILFARNCETPDQIRRLVDSFHDALGSNEALVLIDQEGGRVQRLRPPHWRNMPSAHAFAALYQVDPDAACEAAHSGARLIASELLPLGINVNCAPVLDLPQPGAHEIIGDRAYGATVAQIAALGRAVAEGYLAGGVLPVIKHIPGHGRANADSHFDLPVIDAPLDELDDTDFAPFRLLADMPLAMTAHVLLTALDQTRPASASRRIMEEVIRGRIGFDGFVMSDDLGMKALKGRIDERARAVIDAGSDAALHCSGTLSEMEQVAASVPELAGDALRRFEAARARLSDPEPFDETEALARIAQAEAAQAAA